MALPNDEQLSAHLDGVRAAHRRLLASVEGLDDATARRASLLPGWSVGHVLTHLARNADSNTWVLAGAVEGEERVQYPGGVAEREADIAAGAGRSAAELLADVRDACGRLEAVYERMTPAAWDRSARRVGGTTWPCRSIPLSRWREVTVHHTDLGLGFAPDDWSDAYVAAELPVALGTLDDRITDPTERRQVLAWLIGRADQPGDLHLTPWGSSPRHYGP